jgi:hypothetical protein
VYVTSQFPFYCRPQQCTPGKHQNSLCSSDVRSASSGPAINNTLCTEEIRRGLALGSCSIFQALSWILPGRAGNKYERSEYFTMYPIFEYCDQEITKQACKILGFVILKPSLKTSTHKEHHV